MRKITEYIVIWALAVFLTGVMTDASAQQFPSADEVKGLEPGMQAPHFESKDAGNKTFNLSEAFDVAFKPSAISLLTYNVALGAKLRDAQTDDTQRLPIPATFIIDTGGLIVWRHFDPNYKKRTIVAEILQVLETIE